jgi:hypothetical protein
MASTASATTQSSARGQACPPPPRTPLVAPDAAEEAAATALLMLNLESPAVPRDIGSSRSRVSGRHGPGVSRHPVRRRVTASGGVVLLASADAAPRLLAVAVSSCQRGAWPSAWGEETRRAFRGHGVTGGAIGLVRGHGATGRAIGLVLLSRPRQQKMSSAMEPLTTQ